MAEIICEWQAKICGLDDFSYAQTPFPYKIARASGAFCDRFQVGCVLVQNYHR